MKRRLAFLLLVLAALTGGTLGDDPSVVPPVSIVPVEHGGGPDDEDPN
jgi:hypothetical protein